MRKDMNITNTQWFEPLAHSKAASTHAPLHASLQETSPLAHKKIIRPKQAQTLSILRATLLIIIFLSLPGWSFSKPTENQTSPYEKHHVLLLNSYNKGYGWTDNEVQGVESVLPITSDAVLHTEYMSTKLINTPEYYKKLRDLYAFKYQDIKFDAIIATDDNALIFLRQYRDELFPKVPVIFCGINNFDASKVADFTLYTGVNEESDYRGNLDLISKLHPKVSKVYVINDELTTGKIQRKRFSEVALAHRDRFSFEYLDNYNIADLKKKLKTLEKDSVLFFLSFFKDADGTSLVPQSVIPEITSSSAVPVYGASDYMVNYGMLGGLMKSSQYQGIIAGQLARRVLDGEDVSSIPVVFGGSNQYIFDYIQMTKFGISPAQLPQGSIIINEPESFYYKYRKVIWTTILVFVGLVAYIVVLLFNIKKRIRAQKGLQTIIDASAALFDTSTPDAYKNSLFGKLKSLMPLGDKPLFFKPAMTAGSDHTNYLPVSDDSAGAVAAEIPESVRTLLDRSVRESKSVVDKKAGVAYFSGKSLPGNLVYLKAQGRFDDLDRDLLEIFTQTISMAFDSLEKHKMEEALETARKIQMSMLPKNFHSFSEQYGIDLHAFLIPAKEVGGDLYDFFSIDDDHLCFTVGDVSDKGIPAALFMVMAKTLLRSAAETTLNPNDILYKVNNELSRDNEQSMFVTQFLAVLNRRTGVMTYANAGHNPPYIIGADGGVTCLNPKIGMVLGAFPGVTYECEQIQFSKGDALAIYSDGVTEAKNEAHAMFEEARLEKTLAENGRESAEKVVGTLINDVRTFTMTAPQSDDITVLFVRNGATPSD